MPRRGRVHDANETSSDSIDVSELRHVSEGFLTLLPGLELWCRMAFGGAEALLGLYTHSAWHHRVSMELKGCRACLF